MAAKLNKMVHQGEAAFASYSPQRSRNAAEQQQPAVQRRPFQGEDPSLVISI